MVKIICVTSVMLLTMSSLAVAQDKGMQPVGGSLAKSTSACGEHDSEQSSKEAQKQSGATKVSGENNNSIIVACSDAHGKLQYVKIKGMKKNTVIVNCQTDMDGDSHITVKGDGAVREIGTVKLQGGVGNVFVINNRQLDTDSEILVEGKNAKASVGNVEVKGASKTNKSTIINSTTINGARIEAQGDGASVSVGTVIIGD